MKKELVFGTATAFAVMSGANAIVESGRAVPDGFASALGAHSIALAADGVSTLNGFYGAAPILNSDSEPEPSLMEKIEEVLKEPAGIAGGVALVGAVIALPAAIAYMTKTSGDATDDEDAPDGEEEAER